MNEATCLNHAASAFAFEINKNTHRVGRKQRYFQIFGIVLSLLINVEINNYQYNYQEFSIRKHFYIDLYNSITKHAISFGYSNWTSKNLNLTQS